MIRAEAAEEGTLTSPPTSHFVSFEDLAVPLFDSAYGFALRLTRCEADAQDLIQETYLKALRSFDTFQAGTNFRAWIFRILKNTYLDSIAIEKKWSFSLDDYDELLAELPSSYPDPLTVLIHRSLHEAVQAATQQLPVIFHEVLSLCHFEELSYRDAAEVLSIPLGTVMSRLARARKAVGESIRTTLAQPPRTEPYANRQSRSASMMHGAANQEYVAQLC